MRYSILCPTRGRPNSIIRLLDSIHFTVVDGADVEILFAVDNNDTEDINFINEIINSKRYMKLPHIRLCLREQSEFLNRDYYNWLAEQAKGDYLWAIGDDVVFQVGGWDRKLAEHIENYLKDKKDRIVGVGVRDNTPKPKPTLPQFPCFPIITKETLKTIGFLLHPNIPTWGADYLFYLLYVGIDRYLPISDDIYLLHIGIHTRSGPKDDTASRIEKIFNQLKMNPDYNIDRTAEFIIPQQILEIKERMKQLQ